MPSSRDELDRILRFLLEFATAELEREGSFYPLAAELGAEGEPRAVMGHFGARRPEPSELLDLLGRSLRTRAEAGSIRASGIAADVRIGLRDSGGITDAVQVLLEHRDGEPVRVYVPYVSGPDGYAFGEPFECPGERAVFAS